MKTRHLVFRGDSRNMADIQDASVHLVVTSPPYWQLKDYGAEDQIGFDDSYERYINHLNLVWRECHRVLHPGCRLVVNIGDQFARAVYYGRYKVIPIRTEIIRFCETIGFDYMGAIIWQKKTTMNTTGGATVMGSYPYPRNGIIEIDYEFILLFKKHGKAPAVSREIKEQSRLTKEQWKTYFSGHWYFNGERQTNHVAMYPVELPKRIIEMFTFVGETVLDPFLGSGTTTEAAILTGRNSVGYEINRDFIETVKVRLKKYQQSGLFGSKSDIRYKETEQQASDWNLAVKNLPYQFQDPLQVDKKMDPRKMKFGSRVSAGDDPGNGQREDFFSVKKIIDVNLVQLNNEMVVRLLGVKPLGGKEREALEFLNKKIGKGRVYLKFDAQKYDGKNRLLAYLYMKNKTFINAHLIKRGLAEVDSEIPFRMMPKFFRLRGETAP